jgi:hypothetical protein
MISCMHKNKRKSTGTENLPALSFEKAEALS